MTARTFLLAGGSGSLGTALRVRLAQRGDRVTRLVRRTPATASEFRWDPAAGLIDTEALAGVDVVVNLAGAGVANRPWTYARRLDILQSRRDSTVTLTRALARHGTSPLLIQGSAIGWYGLTSPDDPYTEDAPAADDWLATVVRRWEASARPAVEAGLRVAFLRTSPVMDAGQGVLKLLRLPFAAGLGARLGHGRQQMAMIGLTDWLDAVCWIADHETAAGPYNLTIPQPCTNAGFTEELAAALGRKARLAVPAKVLTFGLGELAEQLLADQHVIPDRLQQQGFRFTAPDVATTVRMALSGSSARTGSVESRS